MHCSYICDSLLSKTVYILSPKSTWGGEGKLHSNKLGLVLSQSFRAQIALIIKTLERISILSGSCQCARPEVAAHQQRQLGKEICGMFVQTKCGEKADTVRLLETVTKRDRKRQGERERGR